MMESFIKEYPVLFYVDAVWIGLVSLAGVIGNSLALCAAATTPSLRTSTHLHIAILAGVDLFITAVLAPCRIATEYFSGQWPRHEPWCHFLAYAVLFFMGYSLQQLMYLAQNRFLRVTRSDAVYRKFVTPLIVIQQVGAVLITSMLVFLPLYTGFGSVGYHPKSHFCFSTGPNQLVLAAASMVLAGAVTLFYGLTLIHVRAHRRKVDNWRGLRTGEANTYSGQTGTSGMEPSTSVKTTTHPNEHVGLNSLPVNGQTPGTQGASTGVAIVHPAASSSIPGSVKQGHRTPSENCNTTDVTKSTNIPISVNSSVPAAEASVSRPVPILMKSARGKPKSGRTNESMKITRNLLLIFCAYMCCWLPWCILSLIESSMDIPIPVYHVISNMVWTNSCINPYLYASMTRNYRNAFKRCMKLKCLSKR